MNIESPPSADFQDLKFDVIGKYFVNQDVTDILRKANFHYLYWSELKRKSIPEGLDAQIIWSLVKLNRRSSLKQLRLGQVPDCKFGYQVTEPTLEKLHKFDMYMGGVLKAESLIPNDDKAGYLLSSIMEEAIASSQLEGAATTREVAKDMLRKKRKPRNKSEQMIMNNYQTIQYILEIKNQPLTPEILCQIQLRMTKDTLSNPNHEGRFRQNDDVRVEDYVTGEVVHIPPKHVYLDSLLDAFCSFANEEWPAKTGDSGTFIHPIIRACILHFLIGYIHPFADGNGRTARAVFYWYMLQKGYWLLEYMSISRIIHKSAAQYARAYLYTEHDENDLTYFINYQVKTLDIAFNSLQQYIERKVSEKKQFYDFRRLADLNERQISILQEFISKPDAFWTIGEAQNRFNIVYQTARTDLNHLVSLGLISKKKEGKLKYLYFRAPDIEDALKRLKQKSITAERP